MKVISICFFPSQLRHFKCTSIAGGSFCWNKIDALLRILMFLCQEILTNSYIKNVPM